MEGIVKWFNVRKGYGFITGDDNEEYFIHYTQVPEGVKLNENDKVTFEPAETDKGKQAQNIQPVEGGAAPAEESTEESTEESSEEFGEEPAEESTEDAAEESTEEVTEDAAEEPAEEEPAKEDDSEEK